MALRHLVLLGFKAGTDAATVAEIERRFAALKELIPEVVDLEWGRDESPEGLQKGHTHCFLLTFADRAGRDVYLPHPRHQDFVAFVGPHVETVTVVDYPA